MGRFLKAAVAGSLLIAATVLAVRMPSAGDDAARAPILVQSVFSD
jgi:hypothetical protein